MEAKIKLYRRLFDLAESAKLDIRGSFGYVSTDNIEREAHDCSFYVEGGVWYTSGNYGGGDHVVSRIGKGCISISES